MGLAPFWLVERAAVTRSPGPAFLALLLVLGNASSCRGEPQKQPARSPVGSSAAPPRPARLPARSPTPPARQSLGASEEAGRGGPVGAAQTTGGFDGQKAYAHVEKLVALGPRPPASEAIRRAQGYIREQLASYGCAVDEDSFSASTPIGRVPMRNLIAKIPGASPSVVLLLTHYDTKQLPDFVGANDGGSSTGVMLEMARRLCRSKNGLTIWIAFLDGEEAFREWSETDGAYGSRQMAARLALSGELKKIKAVLLADMVGYRDLRLRREPNSTRWLTDLVWSTAARLGYGQYFVPEEAPVEDDHTPFLRRGVSAVDLIELEDYPHWHTSADTLDKLSPRSLAIVGHVLLESLSQLETKFR